MRDEREYRLMLSSDIEDYGSRRDADQVELQKMLIRLLDGAGGAAGLPPLDWKRQPQGDGEFTLLPPGANGTAILETFVPALVRGLSAVNDTGRRRMRLRLAVHGGPIHVDGAAGSPGGHAVQVGRLVGAAPLRVAMSACPEADLGVIVSERFFEDFVGQGYGGPSSEDFRHVHVEAKTQKYRAYVTLPGHNVYRLAELDEYDVEREARGKPTDPGRTAPQDGVSIGRDQISTGGDYYGGSAITVGDGSTVFSVGRDGFFGQDPRRGWSSR